MGPRPRAGAYTYDWVERLLGIDIENREEVLPEYQRLEVDEFLGLNDKGQGLKVRAVETEKYLVVQWIPQQNTWAFALYPQPDGTTRFSYTRHIQPDNTASVVRAIACGTRSPVSEERSTGECVSFASPAWRRTFCGLL